MNAIMLTIQYDIVNSINKNITQISNMTEADNYQNLRKQENYKELTHAQVFSRIVEGRMSVIEAQKYIDNHQNIQQIVWYEDSEKEKVIGLALQGEKWIIEDQKKEVTMRETKRNINEMNKEVLKMRKSLTVNGIINETQENNNPFKNPQINKQKQEQKQKQKQEGLGGEKEQGRQNEQKQDSQKANTDKDRKQQEQVQQIQRNNQEQSQQEKAQNNQTYQQKQQKYEQEDHKTDQHHEEQEKHDDSKEQVKQQEKEQSKQSHKEEQEEHIQEQHQQEEHKSQSNQYQQHLQSHITQQQSHPQEINNHQQQPQSTIKIVKEQKKVEDNHMQYSQYKLDKAQDKEEQEERKQQKHENIKSQTNEKQQKNPFNSYKSEEYSYMASSKLESNNSIVKEHHSRSKKKIKKPQSPKDPVEKLIYRYKDKMSKIFHTYSKEMYQPGVTFDQNQKEKSCMDLRIFLKYYKDYDLAQYYKVNLITKSFKKYATHGIWLNQQNFLKIHEQILTVPTVQGWQSQQQKIKRLQIIHQKIITTEKVNKTLNIQQNKQLRSIVESHSGSYKEDIVEKLKERRMELERKHKKQAQKILQKYRNQASIKELKNTQSMKNSYKLNSYSKINKLKDEERKKNSFNEKSRIRSEAKLYNPQGQLQNISRVGKKQIYRQLSLPKLPKRKLRQQNIYEALKIIQTKNEIKNESEVIKNLINSSDRDEEEYFNSFLNQQKKNRNQYAKHISPVQQRMKFS